MRLYCLLMKNKFIQIVAGIFLSLGLMYLLPLLVWYFTPLNDWIVHLFDRQHSRHVHILARQALQLCMMLFSLLICYKLYKRHLCLAIGILIAIIPIAVIVYHFHVYPLTLSGRISDASSYVSGKMTNEDTKMSSESQEIERVKTMLSRLKSPVQASLSIVVSSDYQESIEIDIRKNQREELGTDGGLNIEPNEGGDIGELTVHISGVDFPEKAEIRLTRSDEDDIVGKIIKLDESKNSLYVTFDLRRAKKGAWILLIKEMSKNEALHKGQFQIVEGKEPSLEIDIVGPDKIGINKPSNYHFIYRNTGNVDLPGAHVGILGFPKTAKIGGNFGFYVIPLNLSLNMTDNKLSYYDTEDRRNISFNILTIPGKFTGTLILEVTVPEDTKFTLEAHGL